MTLDESKVIAEARAADDAARKAPGKRHGRRPVWRALSVGAAIVAVGGVVAAVQLAPEGVVVASANSVLVSPVASAQDRVCPGPLTLLGLATDDPTLPATLGTTSIRLAGDEDGLEVEPVVASTPAADDQQALAPVRFTVPGLTEDGSPTAFAAAQTLELAQPSAGGFAATACRMPSAEQWLVGGSTAEGSSTQLVMVNSADQAADVRVTVSTADGVVQAPTIREIVVPASSREVVSLEGVAPDRGDLVVHVEAVSGSIISTLHQTRTSGATPSGIEIVGAQDAPSTSLSIVGVPSTSTASEAEGTLVLERGATLRVLAPGDEQTELTVDVRDAAGTALEPISLTIEGGRTTEIPLTGYPIGQYTLEIDASNPVVAAVQTTATATASDLAWYLPVPVLSDSQVVAVPNGPSPKLQLADADGVEKSATLIADDGTETAVTIPAHGTTSIDVEASREYRLEGLDRVSVQLAYAGDGQLAAIPSYAANPLAEVITVYR
ncbi:DUF5719 family protein [Pseudoclavibacter sp. RFBG4]|uniref:DUF5719 family protein n=1 Tax=Pseudoclavibacter sp. RFBG4 TaxID=2080575 RepID=UPI0011B04F0B|nr:DUF5719 family protein [Pseudoclavibacter sp. RFBG4]